MNFLGLHPLIRESILALKPGSDVLDVGCGVDMPLKPFVETLGHRYTGLDTSIHPVKGDVHYLREALGFDLVVCLASLPHINRPELALKRIWTALKPRGVIVGTWPFVYGATDAASYVHLSANGLGSELSFAGFYNIEIEPEWPLHKSIPTLLFPHKRKGCFPFRVALESSLFFSEMAYRLARRFGTCFNLPPLDERQRDFDTAGAFAFRAVKK